MNTRQIRGIAAAAAVLLVALLGYIPSAFSAIGASNAPFTTGRLDLRSATFRSGPGNVLACFDQPVGAIAPGGEALFSVEGYDANGRIFTWPAGGGLLDANPNCITLPVAPAGVGPSSIQDMTIFKVNGPGAVTGTAGQLNTPGAVALAGNLSSNLDKTDAPELQNATPVAGGQVDYTFDRNLDADLVGLASSFGYQTAAGDTGTCIGAGGLTFAGNTARVPGFIADPATTTPAGACGNPAQGVRFFADTFTFGAPACMGTLAVVDRGTISIPAGLDFLAKFNPLGVSIPSGAFGTDDPDLTGATKFGPNSIDAKFDESLLPGGASLTPGCFLGFEGDGDVHYGDAAFVTNPGGASDTVRVTFTNLPNNQLQIFGVMPGAVLSSVTAGEPNSYGVQEFVGERVAPGFSDAPDLEQVTTNNTADTARYCYDTDETLNPASVVFGMNQVLDTSGSVTTPGIGLVGVAGNCATIQLPGGTAATAVAGGVVGLAAGDSVGPADMPNFGVIDPATGNASVLLAHVATNGPAPTAGLSPAPVPIPGAPGGPAPAPAPAAPGTPPAAPGTPPTITVGADKDLCDGTRVTAALSEILIGNNSSNKICGYEGHDEIRGLGGPDDLQGGNGNDLIVGGFERDNIRGGFGNDTMKGGAGADTMKGGLDSDTAKGGGANDLCRAEIEKGCEV